MPTIVRRQVDSVSLMIRCYDDANDVQDAVFANVFLVDAQHIRWRGDVRLRIIVKLISVELSEISRFANTQDNRLKEAVKSTHQLLRRHLVAVPGADSALRRFEQSIFADTLLAAEH